MYITQNQVNNFEEALRSSGSAVSTAKQYARAAGALVDALNDTELTQKSLADHIERLKARYASTSLNAIIAALNAFLSWIGSDDMRLSPIKVQRRIYSDPEREMNKLDYDALLAAAKDNPRLTGIVRTLGSAGIRISELRFITVEAAKKGSAEIDCKGKHKTVLLAKKLCDALIKYAKAAGITTGSIFITRNGNPVDRSNIAKELKRLAEKAKVNAKKVFPHNFRHFFARQHYKNFNDIVRLADILGHSSIDTTRIYTMESGEVHRKQLDLLCFF